MYIWLNKKVNNKLPLILIYIICFLFIIYVLINKSNYLINLNENFSLNKKFNINSFIINKTKIDILLKNNNFDSNKLSYIPYLGCFIPKKTSDLQFGNLVKTDSLKSSYDWNLVTNGLIPERVIVDLSYNNNGKLSCIALGYFKEKPEICFNKKIFEYYEKEDTDITSKWIKIDPENSNNCKFFMRSIIYDNENFKLLGVNSNDGQIYEKSLTTTFSYNNWDGPINKDIPMKKILFDKHDLLVGIGLLDNYIYRKKDKNWSKSPWNTETINRFEVFDLLYDVDACFIASTKNGIYKQKYSEFSSKFEKYEGQINDTLMKLSISDILKYRTGYEYLDLLFSATSKKDQKILQKLYEYKKLSKFLCKNNKKKYMKQTNTQNQFEKLNKQNETIDNLYNLIENLNKSLNI